MRTTDEIKASLFHQQDIPPHGRFRHGISPACLILMYIYSFEKQVLSVQEKTFVGSPLKPTKPERSFYSVYQRLP